MAQVAREVQWALVWVAAEYVFGVMMGVLSEQHRISPASHWSTPLHTAFWLAAAVWGTPTDDNNTNDFPTIIE